LDSGATDPPSSTPPNPNAPGATERFKPAEPGGDGAVESGTLMRYFGDYELIKELGRGGVGVVYLARQLSLKRRVALKVLKSDILAGDDERRRFKNEAEAVALLDHPHIVPIYEVGEHDGRQFFSMKMVGGSSLEKKLAAFAANPKAAARLVKTAAEAVHHAHQRGILHRDLKPSNILLDEHGEPHVTDLGLAKRVDRDSELTVSGAILGTPPYMAPEQASGRRGAVTTVSDVYGLGAILYALLTGRAPFEGDSVAEILEKVRDQPAMPLSKFNPRTPRNLEIICLKCLEKDSRRRYASAQALAEDLGYYLAGEPIKARSSGPSERLWLWCKRNPKLAGAVGVAAAALAAVTLLSILFAGVKNRAAHESYEMVKKLAGEEVRTRKAMLDAETQLAYLYHERGLKDCDEGEAERGMSWFAECLGHATRAGDATAERAARLSLDAWRHEIHEIRAFFTMPAMVSAVALGPDGGTILAGGLDGTARLWDAKTRMQIGQPMRHPYEVGWVGISSDGKVAVTANGKYGDPFKSGECAYLWDASTGAAIGRTPRHRFRVKAVAISPDSRLVATGGADGLVLITDLATQTALPERLMHEQQVTALAFSPDSRTLLVGLMRGARLWDTTRWQPVGLPLEHRSSVMAVAFSPEGRVVLTGGDDGKAQLWNVATAAQIGEPMVHGTPVDAAVFSPDGRMVLTQSIRKTVRLWDRASRHPIGAPLDHRADSVTGFTLDGERLVADNRLWDLTTLKPIGGLFPGAPCAIAPDRSGRTILAGYGVTEVIVWVPAEGMPASADKLSVVQDKRAPEPYRVGQNPLAPITAGFRFMGGINLRRLLDFHRPPGPVERTRRGKPINNPFYSTAFGAADFVTHDGRRMRLVARSSDGKKALAVQGIDVKALLLDLAHGRFVGQPMQHSDSIEHGAFNPDDSAVATVDSKGTVRLWNGATGEPTGRAMRSRFPTVVSVDFSPDGGLLATKTLTGVVQLWDTLTCTPVGRALQSESRPNTRAVGFTDDGRSFGPYKSKLWATPSSLRGDPLWVRLWVQRITGLKQDGHSLVPLSASEWNDAARQFENLGGCADNQ
jgi:WD40 repeat protein/tRNA A-37 threonylcarbamoyl transferase component Bud32